MNESVVSMSKKLIVSPPLQREREDMTRLFFGCDSTYNTNEAHTPVTDCDGNIHMLLHFRHLCFVFHSMYCLATLPLLSVVYVRTKGLIIMNGNPFQWVVGLPSIESTNHFNLCTWVNRS